MGDLYGRPFLYSKNLKLQVYYLFPMPYRIIKGDFCAAFSGGWGDFFIVVDDTIAAFIYHFTVSLDIGGFA